MTIKDIAKAAGVSPSTVSLVINQKDARISEETRQRVLQVIEQSNYNECVYLIGSHEYAMMHSETDDYYRFLFENYGGPATVKSYGGYRNILNIHGNFY